MALNKIDRKKKDLVDAIQSLKNSLKIAPEPLGENEIELDITKDLLRNGLLQKFEYTVEILWKTLQNIYKEEGLEFQSPKNVFRHRFTELTILSEEEKTQCLLMIDHRNQIAHEYKDYIMAVIYPAIFNYVKLIEKLMIRQNP